MGITDRQNDCKRLSLQILCSPRTPVEKRFHGHGACSRRRERGAKEGQNCTIRDNSVAQVTRQENEYPYARACLQHAHTQASGLLNVAPTHNTQHMTPHTRKRKCCASTVDTNSCAYMFVYTALASSVWRCSACTCSLSSFSARASMLKSLRRWGSKRYTYIPAQYTCTTTHVYG